MADVNLSQTQDELEFVAWAILQASPELTYHQAYLKACRLLALVEVEV